MKYTKKFQQGGYLAYVPTPLNPPTLPTYNPGTSAGVPGNSSAQQAGGFDWLDKDLKKELLKGGLTNDVNALYSQLAQIGNSPNAFLDPNNRQMIYAVGAQINELQRNKEMWANSYGIAEKSGGLSEVAVGNNGEIYVRDSEGIIRGISVEAYKKRPQLYTALSVAELLEKRNTDRQLTNNNEVFNVANNAIGMNNIVNHIDKIVKALGTESQKESNIYDRDGLIGAFNEIGQEIQITGRSMTDSEQKGFRILNAIRNSPSKYNEVMTSESSERNHAEKAIKYIWTTLGDNAQRKLSAQAALNNTSVEAIITSAVLQGTDYSTELDVKPISEAQAKTGSGSGSDFKNTEPLNNFQTMLRGTYATDSRKMVFNDPEYAAKFQGLVLGQNPLTTPDEKPIGPTTIGNIFKNAGYENYVDTDNIYFGNTKVSIWDWNNIVTDGAADVTHVLMPVDEKGQPDNASLAMFREVMEEYNAQKDTLSHSGIQRLFNNSGFQVKINEDKTINVTMEGSHVKPFLITTAYTNSAVRNLMKTHTGEDNTKPESGGLRELSNNENKAVKPIIKGAWTITEGGKTKNIEPSSLWRTEHLYKGLLYMPLRDNYVSRADSSFKGGPRIDQYREEVVMQNNQHSSGIRGINASIEELNNGK